jgi:hypothetical protein
MLRLQCVTVDCTNPKLLADFWSEALDWEIGEVKEHEAWLQPRSKAAQEVHYPDLLFYYSPDSIDYIWIFDQPTKQVKLSG